MNSLRTFYGGYFQLLIPRNSYWNLFWKWLSMIRHCSLAATFSLIKEKQKKKKQTSILSIFWLSRNLGNVKEKPSRKTCFSREMKRLALRIYLFNFIILLGGISLMSTKFLLYFHEKEMLKQGRLCEQF